MTSFIPIREDYAFEYAVVMVLSVGLFLFLYFCYGIYDYYKEMIFWKKIRNTHKWCNEHPRFINNFHIEILIRCLEVIIFGSAIIGISCYIYFGNYIELDPHIQN